ncbi:uncharacterized protein MAM_07336 [Metarhizium album ARSEF 1941]|uniref:DUF7909 domain-containing protein n=1 Tax=Metarhizium album (strain ARSEF 1941) TaxID=1081103 RepID=A0A0B2WP35_METAS|nr:uncharacterized protein MAM_07336 [Metarhizium album ARSEF 1941]KHN94740.1 hypothetical protein MAM_07336 [Metarhizium album ARSEF 1941]
MWLPTSLIAIAVAAATLACEVPPGTPPDNIPEGFAIQVQNASYSSIHNRLMNQWAAGGGDQHLYLSPAGSPAGNLALVNGVITQLSDDKTIRAVINGEVCPSPPSHPSPDLSSDPSPEAQYTAFDNTTKVFMTERGDPRAIYDVAYGCNPDTDALQTELVFKERAGVTGGHICVRPASGNRYEFRYSPPGNTGKSRTCPAAWPLLQGTKPGMADSCR